MDGIKQIIATNITSGKEKNDLLLQALKANASLSGRVLPQSTEGNLSILTSLGVLDLKTSQALPRGTLVQILINPDSTITLKLNAPNATAQTQASTPNPLQAIKTALQGEINKAATTQGNLSNLFALTSNAVAQNNPNLPPQVAKLLPQLLNLQLPTDQPLDSASLQKAIQNSGVFLEGKLANPAIGTNIAQDLKGILLQMQNVLRAAITPSAQPQSIKDTNLPRKGVLSTPSSASIANIAAGDINQQLLQETDAALARIKLHQYASLDERAGGPHSATTTALKEWQMELPFTNGTQVHTMPLQIREEDSKKENAAGEIEHSKIYRLRFAIDTPETGATEANITYQNGNISIRILSDNTAVATKMQQRIPDLKAVLEENNLHVEELFAAFQPKSNTPKPITPAGYFVDHKA